MNKICISITFIGTFLGIIILIFALIQLKKALKKFNNVTDKEFLENSKLIMRKYIIVSIIGISITSIMQLVRLFFKIVYRG